MNELFSIPCILKSDGSIYFVSDAVKQNTPVGETIFLELKPKNSKGDINDIIRIPQDSFHQYFEVKE